MSMEFYRICKGIYANELTTSGIANRWNIEGEKVIYAGSTRSLSSLEMIVHRSAIAPDIAYKVIVISIKDDASIKKITSKDLPENWRSMAGYSISQQLGSSWYKSNKALLLLVPSAVIPQEYNVVINTTHPDFRKSVKIDTLEPHLWDSRLFG